ncbi:MAG: phosphate ABC transporter substrate-binding protein PstS [Thermodesulfobacteriota bacterium]
MNRAIDQQRYKPRDQRGRYFMVVAMAVAALGLCLVTSVKPVNAADPPTLSGAGATFPYPIYSKWASQYHQHHGLKMTYQAIGSGGGIAQIKAKTVQFGASDDPLKPGDLDRDGLIQFPMVIGGVVPVFNLEGVRKGSIKLTPELLADIFMGEIKNWNDRRIKAVNPDIKLPDQEITVVHRADGSGTTWIFTTYLSKVSPAWKEKVGANKAVSWPTGVGGKGNPGVAALVKQVKGSIGYVEFAYALKEHLKYVQLQNKAGDFVKPAIQTFQAAAENADWENAPGYYMDLTDQPGAKTWPITGTSYILVHKHQPDKDKAEAMLKFFDWCYKNGSNMATELHYVPIPPKVVRLVERHWAQQLSVSGNPVWNEPKAR